MWRNICISIVLFSVAVIQNKKSMVVHFTWAERINMPHFSCFSKLNSYFFKLVILLVYPPLLLQSRVSADDRRHHPKILKLLE